MAIKVKIPKARNVAGGSGKGRGRQTDPVVQYAFLGFITLSLMVGGFFAYWYVKYDRIIEQRFRGPVFATSAKIYAGSATGTRRVEVQPSQRLRQSCGMPDMRKRRASPRRSAVIACMGVD